MPLTGREANVDPPPLRPPASGLLQAVEVVRHAAGDRAWLGGVSFTSEDSAPVELVDLCGANGTVALATGATTKAGLGTAFGVVERAECTGGSWQAADFAGRATRGLTARESWAVERQLEQNTLAIPGAFKLADAAAVQPVSVAVHPVKGLWLLDQAIANANVGQGLIHATPYIVDAWAVGGGLLVSERGGRILSPQGNIIVSGNGYTGLGPDGTGLLPTDGTAGAVWAYATDLMVVDAEANPWLTPDNLAEALDRSVNTIRYRAARGFAVRWSRLLHAAVKLTVQHTTAP